MLGFTTSVPPQRPTARFDVLPSTFTQRVQAAWASFRTGARPPLGEVSTANPYLLFGGAPLPYNPSELISRKGYRIIDDMRRDEQVKAAIQFKKMAVLAAGWKITPPPGKDAEWEPAQFIKQALLDIDGTFESALIEIMSALDYGFSLTEKVFKERDDGKIGIKCLATRYPRDINLQADAAGDLVQIKQGGKILAPDAAPLDKFIVYSYDLEFSNYYGRSDLEAAYRAWWTKTQAYKWMAMLLERMGIPPVFALYNPNDYRGADVDKLRDVLKSLQGATVGAIPRTEKDSLELWAPELAGQVSTVFLPALELLNKDIARALLMPGLIGMTDDTKVGSFARARVHFDAFLLVLERIRQELADRIVQEQIVVPLLAYNFALDPEDYPRFEFLPITEEEADKLLASWKQAVDGKIVIPQDSDEEHIRAMMEFPEADEADQQERADRARELNPPMAAPPGAGGLPGGEKPLPGDQPPEDEQKQMAQRLPPLTDGQFNALLRRYAHAELFAEWNEEDHPRDDDGRFGTGGEGGWSNSKVKDLRSLATSFSVERRTSMRSGKATDELRALGSKINELPLEERLYIRVHSMGRITLVEAQEYLNLSRSKTLSLLQELEAAGHLESRKVRSMPGRNWLKPGRLVRTNLTWEPTTPIARKVDLSVLLKAEWNEEDHPRDDDGRFGSGGGADTGDKAGEQQSAEQHLMGVIDTIRPGEYGTDSAPYDFENEWVARISGVFDSQRAFEEAHGDHSGVRFDHASAEGEPWSDDRIKEMTEVMGKAGYADVASRGVEYAMPDAAPPIKLLYPKHCYENSMKTALHDSKRFGYVEGLVFGPGLPMPIPHAWVVDRNSNTVVDPTLGWVQGARYKGFEYSAKAVMRHGGPMHFDKRSGAYRVPPPRKPAAARAVA